MKYKILLDYKNFIPIDETELQKALVAFSTGQPAIFNHGATDRIHNVLPDYHAILGYNYGYELQPEDWKEIRGNKECIQTDRLLAETKLRLQGKTPERKEITSGVKQLADKMRVQ
jgi:hypothetical protein